MERMVLSFIAVAALASGLPPAEMLATQNAPRTEAKPSAVVNLNTATATDLQALPGIGASTAARIVEYRQKHGPFKKIEDLMNVRGVGERSFLKLRPMITVAPKAETGRSQQ